jgi:hypothetical protein
MLKQDFAESQVTPAPRPEDLGALNQSAQEQLTRELADIEIATAALRRGEPALESWSKATAMPLTRKPRPVWLIIGVLWLSTAILTAGAVVAIATLAG